MVAENIDEHVPPRTTIFVRNLPFTTTDQTLEKEFSQFGPIKKAFVVKDRDKAKQCRGFGYVQFALQDDADKVFKEKKLMNSRELKCSYANKKPKHEKRKKQIETDEKEKIEEEEKAKEVVGPKKESFSKKIKENIKCETEVVNCETENKPKDYTEKSALQRTIVLTGLTAKVKRKAFRVLCEKYGSIENIVYPVSDRAEVTAFIRFVEYKSAIRATQKLTGQKVKKSNTLSAVLLTKEGKYPSKKVQQKSRLIVRNLSFKCEKADITECFSKFGKVMSVSLPTKFVGDKQLKVGCAFVQYDNPIHAKTAIAQMNLKEIKGRPVIIDWAVEKEEFQRKKAENPEVDAEEKNSTKKEKCGTKSFENEAECEEEMDDDDDNEESENVENESEDDKDDDFDEEETEEELEETEEEKPKAKAKLQLKDAKEGRTVFLRNLPYNIDEDMVTEEMEKYGEMEYCKIVIDQNTGRSKGSAFVKFKEKSSAHECSRSENLSIDGRSVVVSLAVTKGKVGEILREKSDAKKDSDKRNLYLAMEGLIARNSPAAEGLSEADMKKREKSLAEKKNKLKNPNYFVSKTRLSVRNLPLSVNTAEFRKAFADVVDDKSIAINNIKILTNKDRKDNQGLPRSLGYGFIDVDTHEHAMALLRATNNNPDIFGANRRPIVEFAVESGKALKIQELKRKKIEDIKNGSDDVPKVSVKEKRREQKLKRIARYKRKKEAKKLSRQQMDEVPSSKKTKHSEIE